MLSCREASSSLSLLRCPGTPGAAPVPGVGAALGTGADDVAGGGGPLGLPALPALRALARLAESGDAFGDPGGWTTATVRAIGCVLVGLPATTLARIPGSALHAMLQGLAGNDQPVISRCLHGTPVIAQVALQRWKISSLPFFTLFFKKMEGFPLGRIFDETS